MTFSLLSKMLFHSNSIDLGGKYLIHLFLQATFYSHGLGSPFLYWVLNHILVTPYGYDFLFFSFSHSTMDPAPEASEIVLVVKGPTKESMADQLCVSNLDPLLFDSNISIVGRDR